MADTSPAPAPITFKKRAPKTNQRKRPATPPPPSDSDESASSASDNDEQSGARPKRRRTAGIAAGSSAPTARARAADLAPTAYAADPRARIAASDDATRVSAMHADDNSKALLGTSKHAPKPGSVAANDASTGPARTPFGPVKAPTNIRTVTTTDFAPDVCKDYKQTGFCGFGDSCKFLHAREDYKQGWELDREWERAGAGRTTGTTNNEEEDDEDAALAAIPFACTLCRTGYTSPVVTRCGHYFCEECAVGRYRRSPECGVCGARTDGVFNAARGLRKLLERKRERAARRREERREAGEEVSSGDDEEGDAEGGG